ncbi:MAG: 2-oxoacid:acceptor oxidoreductase family protein [Candidatus Rokubacteria bacterium]|nr:2-oxoacid:acceptor oxidoreductase family protein [Candidatus Rokubacteria bacterium]
MRQEIRLAGYGGQGIVLAGQLLGKAAALYDGKEAVFTQSYGPEARGGASSADLVIASGPVDYPLVTRPDFLVAMFQEAYERYRPDMAEGGLLVIDSDLVKPWPEEGPYRRIPATRLAEGLGKKIVANVVMLGFFTRVSGLVPREAVETALRSSLAPRLLELNLRAFAAGYEYSSEGGSAPLPMPPPEACAGKASARTSPER